MRPSVVGCISNCTEDFDSVDNGIGEADDASPGNGGAILITLGLFFILVLIFIAPRYCWQNLDNIETRRRAAARRASMQHSNSASNLYSGMSFEERSKFVSKTLKTKKYGVLERDETSMHISEDVRNEMDIPSAHAEEEERDEESANVENEMRDEERANVETEEDEASANVEEEKESCAICFEDFQDDDVIGVSHNESCIHFFHSVCVHEHLLRHDDCPICRRPYLAGSPCCREKEVPDVESGVESNAVRIES